MSVLLLSHTKERFACYRHIGTIHSAPAPFLSLGIPQLRSPYFHSTGSYDCYDLTYISGNSTNPTEIFSSYCAMPGTPSEPSAAASLSCSSSSSPLEAPKTPSTCSDETTRPVANNFWGKDDAGVGPLFQRMHDAKTTCDELKAFYTGNHQIHLPMGLITSFSNIYHSSGRHRGGFRQEATSPLQKALGL